MLFQKKRIKVLARRNLKMSGGKLAAQTAHAVLGLRNAIDPFLAPEERVWWPLLTVVVLEASDKKFEEAKAAYCGPNLSVAYVMRDAGYTEVAPETETCMAWLEDDPRGES